MIDIKKGDIKVRVPKSAYQTHFKPYGWTTVGKEPATPSSEPPKESEEPSKGNNTPGSEDGSKGPQTSSKEDLSKMSDEALKQYASLLGIKTKDLKTREEILKAIESK